MAGIQTGHKAAMTFGTSGFTANFTRIGGFEQTREAIEDTHLQTTTYKSFRPGDVVDSGEFEVEFFYNVDVQPPITGPKELVTITFPDSNTASGGGATIAGQAFLTKFGTPELATDQMMTANATIKWATGPTFTDET